MHINSFIRSIFSVGQNNDVRKRDADLNTRVINPSGSRNKFLVRLPQTGEEVAMRSIVLQNALKDKSLILLTTSTVNELEGAIEEKMSRSTKNKHDKKLTT